MFKGRCDEATPLWAIQLSNSGSPDPTAEWCGSTLVKANKIVTAAHCAQEAASTYTAIQGRDVLSDKSTGKESKVSSIWVDPEYGKQPGHDVAVMTMTTPFDDVETLALETDKTADTAGAASVVYGWGETEGTGPADTLPEGRRTGAGRRVLRAGLCLRGLHRGQ